MLEIVGVVVDGLLPGFCTLEIVLDVVVLDVVLGLTLIEEPVA